MSWKLAKLGDLFQIKHGYAFKGEFFSSAGPYVVLTPGNFFDAGGFKSKGDKEKRYTGRFPESYLLGAGDLIVAMTEQAEGLLGSSALVPEDDKYLHNQRLGLITNLDITRLDKKFLYFLFNTKTVRAQIRATANGAKVRHTSPSRIYDVEVKLPPIRLQRRIAAILSAYDHLIENNTRRIAILEEMARRLYDEWFVHFRFPGHEKVEFRESELGVIPAEATCAPFTEIAEIMSGGTPKKSEGSFWGGSIPFFTPRDAPKEFYALATAESITEAGLARCNSHLYNKDTVFVTARGTVGKAALASRDMAMNQSCYALQARDGYGQLFLFLALKAAVHELRVRSHGAVFDTIVIDTFKQLKVVVPPIGLARDFEARVKPFFDLILSLQKKISNLRAQRDLLLPKLVSGEIDVSDFPLPDEAADAA